MRDRDRDLNLSLGEKQRRQRANPAEARKKQATIGLIGELLTKARQASRLVASLETLARLLVFVGLSTYRK
jgi:hypothetical protein